MAQDSAGNGHDRAAPPTQTRPRKFVRPVGRDRPRLTLSKAGDVAAPPRRVRGRRTRRRISGVAWLAVAPVAILFFALSVLVNQTRSAPPTHRTLLAASQ